MLNIHEYCDLFSAVIGESSPESINENLKSVTRTINIDAIPVVDRVVLSNHILKSLSREHRIQLAQALIQEQIVDQKNKLSHWSLVTAQSSMIDTGYIAQHLVSLQTQIAGQGMRGKGDDLCDGSEVKGANFIDSLDKNGATAPRWNFNSVSVDIMERFLDYKAIFLLSIDFNPKRQYRIRIWKVDIHKHTLLRNRYIAIKSGCKSSVIQNLQILLIRALIFSCFRQGMELMIIMLDMGTEEKTVFPS
mgnify:CR=1 FL=1